MCSSNKLLKMGRWQILCEVLGMQWQEGPCSHGASNSSFGYRQKIGKQAENLKTVIWAVKEIRCYDEK